VQGRDSHACPGTIEKPHGLVSERRAREREVVWVRDDVDELVADDE
jgi:hypothetical protein